MNEELELGLHPDVDELNAFAEGALTEQERVRTMAHLAGCSRCRGIVVMAMPEEAAVGKAVAEVGRSWFGGWRLGLGLAGAMVCAGVMVGVGLHRAQPGTPVERAGVVTPAPAVAATAPEELLLPAPVPAAKAASGGAADGSSGAKARVEVAQAPVTVAQGGVGQANGALLQALQYQATEGRVLAKVHPGPADQAGQADQQMAAPAGSQRFVVSGVAAASAPLALPMQARTAAAPPGLEAAPVGGMTVPLLPMTLPVAGAAAPNAHQGPVADAQTVADRKAMRAPQLAPQVLVARGKPAPAAAAAALRVQAQVAAKPAGNSSAGNSSAAGVALMDNKVARVQGPAVLGQALLPGLRAAVSAASSAGRLVGLDAAGDVYVSRDAGLHWTAARKIWAGRAVRVTSEGAQGGFLLTTDAGSRWMSEDGLVWVSR